MAVENIVHECLSCVSRTGHSHVQIQKAVTVAAAVHYERGIASHLCMMCGA